MNRFRTSNEAGSFAILYGLVLFLLIGFAAVLLDLGALRSERRAAQTTADMAATAGASQLLTDFDGSPRMACEEALRYVDANIPDNRFSVTDTDIEDFCEPDDPPDPDGQGFPDDDSACFADDAFRWEPRVLEVGAYVVTLTWPVDFEDEDYTNNGFSEEFDGHRCERFSVQVDVTEGFVLGGFFGLDEGQTGAPAVARAAAVKEDDIVAALVVLDTTDCQALWASGGGTTGALNVFESAPKEPGGDTGIGVIVVDSDGHGNLCGNHPAIRVQNNTEIYAGVVDRGDGQPDMIGTEVHVRRGAIFSYAVTEEGNAFRPADVDPDGVLAGGDSAPPLPGDEPVRPPDNERTTRAPWHHRYECKDSYAGDPVPHEHMPLDPCPGRRDDDGAIIPGTQDTQYITDFRSRIAADDTLSTGAKEAAGYKVVEGGGNCDLEDFEGGPVNQDVWFDCNLRVDQDVEINGNVVIMGNLQLAGATLAVRAQSSTQDGWIYIDGRMYGNTGSFQFGRPCADPSGGTQAGPDMCEDVSADPPIPPGPAAGVAVIMADGPHTSRGQLELGANVDSPVWVAPYRPAAYRPSNPDPGSEDHEIVDFEDLALWSEYQANPQNPGQAMLLNGNLDDLVIDGVFYMPNSQFRFAGGGQMGQQRAQFIAYRVRLAGSGALMMKPDPSRAEPTFGMRVGLIR